MTIVAGMIGAFGASAAYSIDWSKVTITNFEQLYGPYNGNSSEGALTLRASFDINYIGTEAASGKLLMVVEKADGSNADFGATKEFSFDGPGKVHMIYSGQEYAKTTFALGTRTLDIKAYNGTVLSQEQIVICNYNPSLEATLTTIDGYASLLRFEAAFTCLTGPYLGYARVAIYSDVQHQDLVGESEFEHMALGEGQSATLSLEVSAQLSAGTKYYIALQRTKAATDVNDMGNVANLYSMTYTGPTTINPSGTSGVEELEVSEVSAQVRYYNLQGQRIGEPERGVMHIRCEGNRARLAR